MSERTAEYRAWLAMRTRCNNPKARGWENYGGRGITIFPLWQHSFQAFLDHVGTKPSPHHSLDRIDNDGHYVPFNVRWATVSEQNANRRPYSTGVRKTHCPGHAYTTANTWVQPSNSAKRCRLCINERARDWRAAAPQARSNLTKSKRATL